MDKGLIGNIVYNGLQRQNGVWKYRCIYMYYNMSSLKILILLKLSTPLKFLIGLKLKQTKLKQANLKNLFQWNSNSRW